MGNEITDLSHAGSRLNLRAQVQEQPAQIFHPTFAGKEPFNSPSQIPIEEIIRRTKIGRGYEAILIHASIISGVGLHSYAQAEL